MIPYRPRPVRGAFWRELTAFLPKATDTDVQFVDAATLPAPMREADDTDLRALAGAGGGDAVAARWDAERKARIEAGALRPFVPISATRAAARGAPPAAVIAAGGGGRDFGGLVHQILEWIPLEAEDTPVCRDHGRGPRSPRSARRRCGPARRIRRGRAASASRSCTARAGGAALARVPSRSPTARTSSRAWWTWCSGGRGPGPLDYKTDGIADEQAVTQAAHHAPQLQLYGRGLAQATGMPVRERLVLFTSIGRTVPV